MNAHFHHLTFEVFRIPRAENLLKKTSLKVQVFILKRLLDVNLFFTMSEVNPSMAKKTNVQYKDRRGQVQATINHLLLYTKKKENVKSQIRFLMKCKKNGIIPQGLKSSFLLSISNFSQSGRRLCERFQKKLLNRILSDKYWLMEKFQRKCDSLQDDLKSYNLGSRFYEQNDNMLNKKRNEWRRFDNCRLFCKFAKLNNQT